MAPCRAEGAQQPAHAGQLALGPAGARVIFGEAPNQGLQGRTSKSDPRVRDLSHGDLVNYIGSSNLGPTLGSDPGFLEQEAAPLVPLPWLPSRGKYRYMYICVEDVYNYIYTYTDRYTYTYAFIHTYMHACMHACMHAGRHT